MAIERLGEHYYPTDGHIWKVSAQAAAERRVNHVEIVGWADGYAYVNHADWHALYEHYLATRDHGGDVEKGRAFFGSAWPAFLCYAQAPDGTTAHIGGISKHRDGRIVLSG